jgi:hypothetical protein
MPQVPDNSDKSFVSTMLLCVFVGFLGVNRFYVGKTGTGILMLLTFFWIGYRPIDRPDYHRHPKFQGQRRVADKGLAAGP